MITIIDYKSGNLKSISNGFKKIGCDVEITSSIEKIDDEGLSDTSTKTETHSVSFSKQ